eukprot:TRINITY_DN16275_c0_g1_i1.p1 TRINITY_DN16275_c0_g1~~TRINITY_DN16275_c0_g1_i1.p1  ORF type:complete len:528 (-),score=60.41 TRINITY_DN16275_c0_g1_i1:79-1662(-)
MIYYDAGYWGIGYICKLNGSVFPRAFCWAVPSSVLAGLLSVFLRDIPSYSKTVQAAEFIWSGYIFVLGFLIVFRNNQAFGRFWEGTTLIHQVRGEWFNAISSLVAFCSVEKDKQAEVECLQQLLVRLGSMLHCAALQQICELEDDALEIISTKCFEWQSLAFLHNAHDRCEVLMQWIHRVTIQASRDQVIDVPAAILSRVYQELSRGHVNLNNVRKIKDVPFPFPYAQLLTVMLMIHAVFTPVIAAATCSSAWLASTMCFLVVGCLWSLFYVALEIDQPFGEDANDLEVRRMQQDFNASLLTLLDPALQAPPRYTASDMSRKSPRLSLELSRSGRPYTSTLCNDTSTFSAQSSQNGSGTVTPTTPMNEVDCEESTGEALPGQTTCQEAKLFKPSAISRTSWACDMQFHSDCNDTPVKKSRSPSLMKEEDKQHFKKTASKPSWIKDQGDSPRQIRTSSYPIDPARRIGFREPMLIERELMPGRPPEVRRKSTSRVRPTSISRFPSRMTKVIQEQPMCPPGETPVLTIA